MSEQEMIVDRMGLLEAAGFALIPPPGSTEEVPWKVLRPVAEAATHFLQRAGYKVVKISGHPNARFRVSWQEGMSRPGSKPGPRPARPRLPSLWDEVSVSCSVSVRRSGW